MKRVEGYDMIVLMMAVILTCFGVVMVYSASSVMAAKRFHDGFFFLKRQSLYALIGFAGARVIQQTVRETLPEGFQRSEFLLEKGAIDMIVDRRQLRDQVARVISLLQKLPVAA